MWFQFFATLKNFRETADISIFSLRSPNCDIATEEKAHLDSNPSSLDFQPNVLGPMTTGGSVTVCQLELTIFQWV